jgi:hypothetical protein
VIRQPRSKRDAIPVLAATVYFALVWVSSAFSGYGVFVDELYYLSCAKRIAAGYVDHPPLSIWALRAALVFGDSLPALRLWPALAGGGVVYLSVRLAKCLGGSSSAMILTALATASAPVLMVVFSFYSMNAIEMLLVLGLVSILFEIVRYRKTHLWVWFGGVAGLAALNKHTALVYVAALVGGVALSRDRQALYSRWVIVGAAVGVLVLTPNIVWQVRHHWVSLEFYRNATTYKNLSTPAWKVVLDQLLAANPANLALLVASLVYAFRVDRRLQFVAYAYAGLVALLAVQHASRPDRVVAVLAALFAVGAVHIERLGRDRPWLPWLAGGLALSGAIVLAPVSLPLLSPERVGPYAEALGVIPKIERGESSAIPSWLGDRLGWPEVARAAGRAAGRLSVEERERAAVLGSTYGDSGACEHFGRGLPPVIGRHNAWSDWGPPADDPSVLLLVGFAEAEARRYCDDLTVGATYRRVTGEAVEEPVFVCRRLKRPLRDLWPELRRTN